MQITAQEECLPLNMSHPCLYLCFFLHLGLNNGGMIHHPARKSAHLAGKKESPVTIQQNSFYPSPSNLGFPQQILPRNKVVSAQSKVEEGMQHI